MGMRISKTTRGGAGRVRRVRRTTQLGAFAVCAVLVRVFLACGSPDLEESDSCRRRGGSCAPVGPSGTADCTPGQVLYLDSCFCCAPPIDDASAISVPTFGTDSAVSNPTTDAAGGDDTDTDGATDGAADAPTDAPAEAGDAGIRDGDAEGG